jgi:hydrogenase/urease accessory protein HupE
MFGLTLVLLGAAVAVTAGLPRALGYLMGLSGLAYLVQGWVLGTEGFSANNTFPTLAGYVLILAWIVWLFVVAWWTKASVRAPIR